MATNIITQRHAAPPPVTESHQGIPLGSGIDRTRLLMLPRNAAADAANLALFQLQDKTPEEQVMGAAVLFATFCEALGLDPQETHAMGLRVLKAPSTDDHVAGHNLQALRDFASIRVGGRDTSAW
jgi:hypothetical protein